MREALRLFREARGLLSRRAKRFLAGFVVAQLLLALLDTAALFAIATIFVAGVDAEIRVHHARGNQGKLDVGVLRLDLVPDVGREAVEEVLGGAVRRSVDDRRDPAEHG